MSALVVLLEDDPAIRFGQMLLLRDWGYQVVAEPTLDAARAALEKVAAKVAAIIADFHLGDRHSGAEAACALATAAGRAIPTLLLSASYGRRSGSAAALHGFELMTKPADPDRLRDWLDASISP